MAESSRNRVNQALGSLKAARRAFEKDQKTKGVELLAQATTKFSRARRLAKGNTQERERISGEAYKSFDLLTQVIEDKYGKESDAYAIARKRTDEYAKGVSPFNLRTMRRTEGYYRPITTALIGISLLSLAVSLANNSTGAAIGTEYLAKNIPIVIAFISGMAALFFSLKK